MDCKFVVGQKVVCIRGFDRATMSLMYKDANIPHKGDVLTIKEIYAASISGRQNNVLGYIGLVFKEIQSLVSDARGEVGYEYSHFGPIIERKTDISIFQEMLKVKELENV